MSETKFTPGPWLVEFDPNTDESTLATVVWCGAYRIGIETGINGGNYRDGRHGHEESDAHLIAAAPELYEALASILYHDERGQGIGYAKAMKRGAAALAKARGKS